jgi:hypothetical protein
MAELIVVACNGPTWIGQCRDSLEERAPDASVVYIDTGGTIAHGADVAIPGGHPTGAYLWAVQQYAAYDRFLFVQDSMTALMDPLPWFREQFPATGGAVAWAKFRMQWDADQKPWVEAQYPGVPEPEWGIFGPVFYTDRATLDLLAERNLLPPIPENRIQAQGTERSWAYAFAAAGLPVIGPEWDSDAMTRAFGPFCKFWANRP